MRAFFIYLVCLFIAVVSFCCGTAYPTSDLGDTQFSGHNVDIIFAEEGAPNAPNGDYKYGRIVEDKTEEAPADDDSTAAAEDGDDDSTSSTGELGDSSETSSEAGAEAETGGETMGDEAENPPNDNP
jgi:hypothetical protein